MKALVYLLLFFIVVPSFPLTIQGYVYDNETSAPLWNAKVTIPETTIEARTDLNGFFSINDIAAYKIIITVSYIDYKSFSDTLYVLKSDHLVDLVIKMEKCRTTVETSDVIENYHSYFKKYEPGKALKIVIDSLKAVNNSYYLTVYSSFHNLTDTPIYIIDFAELDFVELVVTNSNGQKVRRHKLSGCIMAESLPDEFNFIKIAPHDSTYYNVFYSTHNFGVYPADDYTIRVHYSYSRKESLSIGNCDNNEKIINAHYYHNMVFRGEVISYNSMTFNNAGIKMKEYFKQQKIKSLKD